MLKELYYVRNIYTENCKEGNNKFLKRGREPTANSIKMEFAAN